MSYQQLIAGKVKLNGLEGIRRHLQERERAQYRLIPLSFELLH